MLVGGQLSEEELKRGAVAMQQVARTHAKLTNIAIPIYAEKSNGVLFLNGSAFLLGVRDATFLITAAHVLAVYPESPLWVSAGGKPFGVNADFTHTKIEGCRPRIRAARRPNGSNGEGVPYDHRR